MIKCRCGCGNLIKPRDSRNRPRLYSKGHSGRVDRVHCMCACQCGNTFIRKKTSTQIFIKGHHNALVGFKKGYTPWNKGKSWTPPNIEQFIEAGKKTRYKKGQMAKEKHPKWNNGVTPEHKLIRGTPEYKKWRDAVFMRDNYTCVKCIKRGGDLIADHIKSFSKYPNLRLVIANGRTLCEKCNYESTYKLKEWQES